MILCLFLDINALSTAEGYLKTTTLMVGTDRVSQTDKQTDRQTDRQTNRDRYTDEFNAQLTTVMMFYLLRS